MLRTFKECLVFLCLFFSSGMAFASDAPLLNHEEALFLKIPGASYDEKAVLSGRLDDSFAGIGKDFKPNMGYTDDHVAWLLRDDLLQSLQQRMAGKDAVLVFDYNLLDRALLVGVGKDGHEIFRKAIGKTVPFASRDLKTRELIFPIEDLKDVSKIYILCSSTGALNVGFKVIFSTPYIESVYKNSVAIFLYFGMAAIMIIYNSFLGFQTRKLTYLFYVMFVVFIFLMVTSLQGVSYEFFWPNSPSFNRYSAMLFAASCGLSISFLTLQNFSAELNASKRKLMKKYIQLSCVLFAIAMMICIVDIRLGNKFTMALIAIFCTSLLGFYIKLSLQKNRQGYYYLASMGAVAISGMIFPLRQMALVPENIFTANLPLFASAFEMALISLALGDKYRQIEITNHKTAAQMIAMQKENIDTLDRKVNERTAEIRAVLDSTDAAVFLLGKSKDDDSSLAQLGTPSSMAKDFFGATSGDRDFDPIKEIARGVVAKDLDRIERLHTALLSSIEEDEFAFEVNSHLANGVFHLKNQKVYKLSSVPLYQEDKVRAVVLSVTDLTSMVAAEKEKRAMAIRSEAIEETISAGKEASVRHCSQLIMFKERFLGHEKKMHEKQPGWLSAIKRDLHTEKGVARSAKAERLSSFIHGLESSLASLSEGSAAEELLQTELSALQERFDAYIWASLIVHREVSESRKDREETLFGIGKRTIDSFADVALSKKGVSLEFAGEGADKICNGNEVQIIEGVLTHLVKNSIDHGVGPWSKKSGRCIVTITRGVSGFFYRDDGDGINLSRVISIAKSKGLVADEASLTNEEIASLIFAPGFSTKAIADELSGRGVGMDAVREEMKTLGYETSIEILDVSKNQEGEDMARVKFEFKKITQALS